MTSKLFGVEGVANSLWSRDLAPIELEERPWKTHHLVAILVAVAVSLPGYLYASCLSALGMSAAAVLGSALVGSLLVAALAVGCGHAGVRYGIPFAVLVRAAFGVVGARMPVAMRLLVCCGWMGIGCWLGAEAISRTLVLVAPPLPAWIVAACFPLVLLLAAAPWRVGPHRLAGALWGAGLLLCLAVSMPVEWIARGTLHPAPALSSWPTLSPGHGIVLGVTALLGLWLPVVLGAADGGRRVPPQRAPVWSTSAIPVATVLFSSLIALTAQMRGGGSGFWATVSLADGVTPTIFKIGCLLVLVAAALLSARSACGWLAGEIAATIPGQVTTGTGRWMVCLAALLTLPWRWVASPERYIGEWLIGCAGLLAPVAAILLVEYFGLRRRWLNVDDLYQRDGLYEYAGGWNWRAFGALATGWAVMMFLMAARSVVEWRGGAVWVGTGVAAAVYWVLRSGPPEVAQIPPTPLLIPLAGFESEGASG